MTRHQPIPLVGREREVQFVQALLEAALRREGAFLVVEGEPGIGKSRVLQEAAARAEGLGFRVASGWAEELQRQPFGAIDAALGTTAAGGEGEAGELARLLHGEPRPGVNLSFRITRLMLALLEEMADQVPLLLLLDDLQWADVSTLAVLAAMLRRFAESPVALIVARRLHPAGPELESFVEALERAGGGILRLDSLDEEAVDALVGGILAAAPGPRLRRHLAGAAGNPLFVAELVLALKDAGEICVRDDVAEVGCVELPSSLRLTILRRLGSLGHAEVELLRLASVLGSSFSLRDLALVSGSDGLELARLLEPPLRAGFVVEAGGGLRFRHDVVREALYHEMPQDLRATLHLEAARRFAAAGREPLAVATHLAVGASSGDDWAMEWFRRAAEQAAPRAPALAVDLLERALEVAGRGHPRRAVLLAEQADRLVWVGRNAEAVSRAEEALSLRPGPTDEARARLALLRAYLIQDLTQQARAQAEAAGVQCLPPALAAQLLAEGAFARLVSGELEAARAAGRRGAELATRHDEPVALVVAQAALSTVALLEERVEDAVSYAAAAVERVRRQEELRQHATEMVLALALMEADRLAEADEVCREGLAWSERTGAKALAALHLHALAVQGFWTGRWDDALADYRRWVDLVAEQGTGPVRAYGAAGVIAVHRHDLRLAREAVTAGQRVLGLGPRYTSSFWMSWAGALLVEASGDEKAAFALLVEAWRDFDSRGLRWHHRLAGPDLVRLAVSVGDRETASAAAEAVGETASLAGVASAEAAALHCRGWLEADGEVLKAAAEGYRTAGRPLLEAMALEAAGRVWAEAGRVSGATEALQRALRSYERLGAVRDVRHVRGILRALGVRGGSRRAQVRAELGWDALTRSELEVAELIGDGCGNREVAERLFISRRTVEAHLRNIFRKLRVSSRSQLATEVVRHRG